MSDDRIERAAIAIYGEFIRRGAGCMVKPGETEHQIIMRRWNRCHETTREQFRMEARAAGRAFIQ